MTRKLYDEDSHLYAFDATVLACDATENGFAVMLDATAFFPEGGGQPADTGTLGDAIVRDVQWQGNRIVHFTDRPLTVGAHVHGQIDAATRFSYMQNHSGEHIVSGLIHSLFGFDNVGFHLGKDDMTMDYSGILSEEQLLRVEALANRAVFENVPIEAVYPTPEALTTLSYRSKKELTGAVRIVTIPGYDCCACCAPHVSRTGEIGLIKVMDFIRYKGGVRVHLRCGIRALAVFQEEHRAVTTIAQSLSARREEVTDAVGRLEDTVATQKQTIATLRKKAALLSLNALAPTDGAHCFFEEDADPAVLRLLVNSGRDKCRKLCGAFSGNDVDGYRYVVSCADGTTRAAVKALNDALSGRGGGTDDMAQGTLHATETAIRSYFSTL